MDNNNYTTNTYFDNSCFNSANLFDTFYKRRSKWISLYNFIEYVDVETFGKQLSQVKSKLSILSLNIQTINTKFDELKIILDYINQHHQISVIYLQ